IALVDHGTVTHHPHAVVAEDLPARDVAARDHTDVRNPEGLAYLGGASLPLLYLRGQHTAHGGLDLLEGLVDHVVGPNLHALALGDLLGGVRGPDVESQQDAVAGRAEH